MMESDRKRTPANGGSRIRVIALGTLVIAFVILASRGFGVFGGGSGTSTAEAQQQAGPPQMPPMPVDVSVVQVGAIMDEVRATGRIEALHAVALRAEEQGRIAQLLFEEGQAVEAGAPLVRIDDALLRAQRTRAVAEQNLAKQQLERVRRMRADNASTPADLDRADAAAKSADATVAMLDVQLEHTTVRAPFSGVIGQRHVSPGDYVTTSTPLLSMQTTNPQRVVIEVPERHAARLRRGQVVEFSVAAYPARVFRAQVDFIDPQVQQEGRSIVVKGAASNPDGVLKPGMFVEARLATATRASAIVVREDAIQPLRTANVVWVVKDGKAERRTVQLGSRSGGMVEILDGVKEGEQVVVGGLERMADGMAVAPRPAGAAGAAGAAAPAAAPGSGASPAAPDSGARRGAEGAGSGG